jgi:Ca-activated chloride channel family protein
VQQAYEILSNPERRRAYDATLPASLAAHPLLRHAITFSRPGLVETPEPQLIYILLEVGARDQGEQISAPPLNVCLVLDRSSSMKGEKLDMAKAAGIHVMRSLRPQDTPSIVAFSDKAEVLIPAGNVWAYPAGSRIRLERLGERRSRDFRQPCPGLQWSPARHIIL